MANDKDHGYKKASLKVKTDRVLTVTSQTIDGDSVNLSVEVTDYDPPHKKIKDITVSIPLSEFTGNHEKEMLDRLDVILEQQARRLVAVERIAGLTGHQKRWQTRE